MSNRFNNNEVTIRIASGYLDELDVFLAWLKTPSGVIAFSKDYKYDVETRRF